MTNTLVPDSPAEVRAAIGYERPEALAWDSKLRRSITIYIPLATSLLVSVLLTVVFSLFTRR